MLMKDNFTIKTKFQEFKTFYILTVFRMGLFVAADGYGEQKGPLPEICHTNPTMIKFGTVIPYLMKI